MHSLQTLFLKRFSLLALIPLLVVESFLLLFLFLFTDQQSDAVKRGLEETAGATLHQCAKTKLSQFAERLDMISASLSQLQTQTKEIFERPEGYSNPDLALFQDGDHYRDDSLGEFSFYRAH